METVFPSPHYHSLSTSSSSWPTFNCASFHSKVLSTEPLPELLSRVILCRRGGLWFDFYFKRLHVKWRGGGGISASLVFGPLFLLALVVFYQHLCCRSAFPWRPQRVLSLFFVGALFKLILDSKHDVCCRMWMFCSCKCTFKLDQKLQYTLNSNMPFVKVTNCYCCCR